MFGDGSLSFHEFVVREPHPLAIVQDAVLDFLEGRDDAALFGAQAVNAYVIESRMTQDVDILSPRAEELSEEIRSALAARFHIATRVRRVAGGRGYRVYQSRSEGNRHLVDVRPVVAFPPTRRVRGILVIDPIELVANKISAYVQRRTTPKGWTDGRDLAQLLLTFPDLKRDPGPVRDRLVANRADAATLEAWAALVASEIRPQDEDAEFD